MANFTAEEIQAAVESLVQSTIRRPYDTLGVRRADISFSDIQQAAAGVFLLYPKAPFYCLSLGARSILELIEAEAQTITALLDAISAVGRRVLPVEDVSPLFNAKVALESLGRAAVERTNVRDITTVPAFQQFEKNVNVFLDKNGDTVREAGEIVDTPQGARKKLATLVQTLEEQHTLLVERVKYLALGKSDYASVNLAGLVAQGVLAKAASVLEGHATALAALKPEERLENMRKVILDLIAAKSVVRKYGSFTGPTKLYSVTGTGTPYSDASHLANPAAVLCDIPGPYSITPTNNILELYLEGSLTPTTIALPYSYWPRIEGAVNEITQTEGTGWIIGDGFAPLRNAVNEGAGNANTPDNDAVRLAPTGVPVYCILTKSVDGNGTTIDATPRTVEQICADLNPPLNPFGWQAVPYMAPRKFYGLVNITPIAGAQGTLALVGGFGNFGTVGITAGMLVNVLDGTEAGLWTINSVAATSLTATRVDAAAVVGALSSTIEIGPKERRLRIEPINKLLALDTNYSIVCSPNSTKTTNGAQTLGLVPGVTYKARQSTAKDLAAYINNATTLAKASAVFYEMYPNVRTITNPSDSTKLTASKIRATASTTTWNGSTLTLAMSGAAAAGVGAGDLLVERSGANIGTLYTVLTASDTQVVAILFGGVASSQTNVLVDIGRQEFAVGTINSSYIVKISSGPNVGEYYVEKVVGLDMTLTTPLPAPMQGLDGTVVMNVTLGQEYLEFASANKTTQSKIKIGGSSSTQFFGGGHPATTTGVFGTTRYFRLPQKVAVGVGDLLLLHGTDYATPDTTCEIQAVESGEILTLDTPIASEVSWVFSPSATVPYARLQTGETFNYDAFERLLTAWTARSQQQPSFFTDLNRFINPLISNSTPTAAQVGDARNKVNDLSKYLTVEASTLYGGSNPLEAIIGTYSISYQQAVDALLRSFKEKGADRAHDFLIQGRFSEFFAMDMNTASYAGAMQKAMRDVVLNDLPISKTNRKDQKVSRLLSSTTSPDPEYSLEDTEQAVPDPVGQGEF